MSQFLPIGLVVSPIELGIVAVVLLLLLPAAMRVRRRVRFDGLRLLPSLLAAAVLLSAGLGLTEQALAPPPPAVPTMTSDWLPAISSIKSDPTSPGASLHRLRLGQPDGRSSIDHRPQPVMQTAELDVPDDSIDYKPTVQPGYAIAVSDWFATAEEAAADLDRRLPGLAPAVESVDAISRPLVVDGRELGSVTRLIAVFRKDRLDAALATGATESWGDVQRRRMRVIVVALSAVTLLLGGLTTLRPVEMPTA